MFLSDEQLKSLCEVLVAKNLLAFKPKIQKLHYDKEGCVHFYASETRKDEEFLYARTHPDSKILAVAHTDVQGTGITAPQLSYDRKLVKARQLDDRLGVWLLLHYLPTVLPKDQPYDILLTDNEERGRSTAMYFNQPEGKQYNWIFEFDRRGTDVVMYDYETPELKNLLKAYGFEVGVGSYTDICMLSHLNCAGFNFGTAYHNEHSNDCWADFSKLFEQVNRFIPFYSEWYNKRFKHDHEAAEKKKNTKLYGYNYTQKKTGGQTNRSRGSGKTNVAGGLDIGGINTQRLQENLKRHGKPPIDMSTTHSRKREDKDMVTCIQTVSFLDPDEIHQLSDDEYLLWTSFVMSNKNSPHAYEDGQILCKQMFRRRKRIAEGTSNMKEYQKWIESKILEHEALVTHPNSEDLITDDQKEFWEDEQLRREAAKEEWDEYCMSDCPDLSFKEWKRNRDIAMSGGFMGSDEYDDRDSYFKHQAKEFDQRYRIIGSDDDTDVMGPSDEDLLALQDEELQARIMEDPLYSSEEFPGGKEARSQHFDNLPNDLT